MYLPKGWEKYLPEHWEMSLPNYWEKYLTFTKIIGMVLCVCFIALVATTSCIGAGAQNSGYGRLSDEQLIARWNQLSAEIDVISKSGQYSPKMSQLIKERNEILVEMRRRRLDIPRSVKTGSPTPVQEERYEAPSNHHKSQLSVRS